MAAPFDVCILGDGIVGHALALLLARERLRVGLVAATGGRLHHHPDVRAYALNHASRSLLEGLRCWPDERHATPVLGMKVQEAGAGQVRFSAVEQGEAALTWIVDVPALVERLAEAVRFQPGIEMLAQPSPAELTAVCEGRASQARRTLGVPWEPADYGQWAIAGRLHAERPHEQVAYQWFTPNDVLGLLPLGEPDGNSMAFVWSVGDGRQVELMAASGENFVQDVAAACGHHFGAMRLVSERACWPLQLATAEQWVGRSDEGVWALVGDAAHVVHPLAGQGLNLGLGDARELAGRIGGREPWRAVGDMRMLRGYERARKAEVWLLGTATDGLQRLFSRTGPAWQGVRQWGMQGFERSGTLKRWVAGRAMGSERSG